MRKVTLPMNDKTLFAWTSPGVNYPVFVNISERDGAVEVTVRSPPEVDRVGPGPTAKIRLPDDRLKEMTLAMTAHVDPL